MPVIVALEGDVVCAMVSFTTMVLVGRRPSNPVHLPSPQVSSSHARVRCCDDGGFLVEDLGSSGGTFVGGRRVVEPVRVEAGHPVVVGPYRLFVTPGPSAHAPAPMRTAFDRFSTVFELERALGEEEDAPALLSRALDCFIEVLGARRGAVLDLGEGGPQVTLVRPASEAGLLKVSRRLLGRLSSLADRAMVECPAQDPLTANITSIGDDVGWLVAGVLSDGERRLGLVYLESPEEGRRFGPRDFAFVESFCSFASRVLARARETRALWSRCRTLTGLAPGRPRMVVHSPAMRHVAELVGKVAADDVTTLVVGATGTGKDLVARTIHDLSRRSAGPFVSIDGGSLAEHLVESELFGHVKGAFSGAESDRPGRLELVEGGTLVLDGVDRIPASLQVKLLRVLQERRFQRVGDNVSRPFDARLLCLTSAHLEDEVARGTFRQDLYYRICVFRIDVPSLQQRREDIPDLVAALMEECNGSMRRGLGGVDDDAMAWLCAQDWPGNVRELRSVIQRAFVHETGSRLSLASLPVERGAPAGRGDLDLSEYPADLAGALALFERSYLTAHVEANGGNLTDTARKLGTSRSSLYRKLRDGLITAPGTPDGKR